MTTSYPGSNINEFQCLPANTGEDRAPQEHGAWPDSVIGVNWRPVHEHQQSNTWNGTSPPNGFHFPTMPLNHEFGNGPMNFRDVSCGFDNFDTSFAGMSQYNEHPLFQSSLQLQPNILIHHQPHITAPFHPGPLPAAPDLSQPNEGQRLHCPKGCARSLRGPGEYRRHMKKHDTPKFKCPFFDCDKTFYRSDKLRDHLKQGHKDNLRDARFCLSIL